MPTATKSLFASSKSNPLSEPALRRSIHNRVEEKIKIKRAFIQFLQTDIEMLAESETDTETKAELKKLAEKVRFSDPMSHEMLGELESRISAKVEEMKTATDKKGLIAEINILLTERNKKCKILK